MRQPQSGYDLRQIPTEALFDELFRRQAQFGEQLTRLLSQYNATTSASAVAQTLASAQFRGAPSARGGVESVRGSARGPSSTGVTMAPASRGPSSAKPSRKALVKPQARKSTSGPPLGTSLIAAAVEHMDSPFTAIELLPVAKRLGWKTNSPRPEGIIRRLLHRMSQRSGSSVRLIGRNTFERTSRGGPSHDEWPASAVDNPESLLAAMGEGETPSRRSRSGRPSRGESTRAEAQGSAAGPVLRENETAVKSKGGRTVIKRRASQRRAG